MEDPRLTLGPVPDRVGPGEGWDSQGAALTVMGRETLSVDDELKAGLGVARGPWRILIF